MPWVNLEWTKFWTIMFCLPQLHVVFIKIVIMAMMCYPPSLTHTYIVHTVNLEYSHDEMKANAITIKVDIHPHMESDPTQVWLLSIWASTPYSRSYGLACVCVFHLHLAFVIVSRMHCYNPFVCLCHYYFSHGIGMQRHFPSENIIIIQRASERHTHQFRFSFSQFTLASVCDTQRRRRWDFLLLSGMNWKRHREILNVVYDTQFTYCVVCVCVCTKERMLAICANLHFFSSRIYIYVSSVEHGILRGRWWWCRAIFH